MGKYIIIFTNILLYADNQLHYVIELLVDNEFAGHARCVSLRLSDSESADIITIQYV
ncbi:MAG TPA: hypothetical protein VE971_01135 [Candidatus Eisenbacteria bacterium]|nr:hypothetical protein [Candidatus Eisenbacteria bacterium]